MLFQRIGASLGLLLLPAAAGAHDADVDVSALTAAVDHEPVYIARAADTPDTTAIQRNSNGTWIVHQRRDVIDDTRYTVLRTDADQTSRWGYPIRLLVACDDGREQVTIDWAEEVGTRARIMTRLDSTAARPQRWRRTEQPTQTRLTGHGGSLVRSLANAETLFARVSSNTGSQTTARFDLSSLRESLQRADSECNW